MAQLSRVTVLEPHLPSRVVARLLGVGTHTLAVWRLTGKGPRGHFHVSKTHVVYPQSEVEKFLTEKREAEAQRVAVQPSLSQRKGGEAA